MRNDMIQSIRCGLESNPKYILPKFLYDRQGSKLFDEICCLQEYYQTRTESAILKIIRHELARYMHAPFRLVELGSGASTKTQYILDAMLDVSPNPEYIPIDISDAMEDYAESLTGRYPNLLITGIKDTYEGGLDIVGRMDGPSNLIAFLGSSLGNMTPSQSYDLLVTLRRVMRPQDLFLIGLDMVKDTSMLESAYNDSSSVTAKFNMNILKRLNRELNANFDLDLFSHYATYNQKQSRIEMYLRSEKDQTVDLPKAGIQIGLHKDELIHTENSYKYTITDIRTMADKCGFSIERLWRDDDELFSLTLMSIK